MVTLYVHDWARVLKDGLLLDLIMAQLLYVYFTNWIMLIPIQCSKIFITTLNLSGVHVL